MMNFFKNLTRKKFYRRQKVPLFAQVVKMCCGPVPKHTRITSDCQKMLPQVLKSIPFPLVKACYAVLLRRIRVKKVPIEKIMFLGNWKNVSTYPKTAPKIYRSISAYNTPPTKTIKMSVTRMSAYLITS